MSTPDGVEVGKVAWIREGRDSDDNESENTNEHGEKVLGEILMLHPLQDIENHFGHQHIDEGENREEVTEADIEIASDADVTVESDEENHHSLSDAITEGVGQEAHPTAPGSPSNIFHCPSDSITSGGRNKEKHW